MFDLIIAYTLITIGGIQFLLAWNSEIKGHVLMELICMVGGLTVSLLGYSLILDHQIK